jgi:hypothetical protein
LALLWILCSLECLLGTIILTGGLVQSETSSITYGGYKLQIVNSYLASANSALADDSGCAV